MTSALEFFSQHRDHKGFLQVTNLTAYEIRKITGKFTLHFICLPLKLNKLLRKAEEGHR